MEHSRKLPFAVASSTQTTAHLWFPATARTSLLFRFSPALCLAVCLAFSVLSACARPKEAGLKEDLTKYMEQAQQWTAAEAQINNAIITVRRDQFVDDEHTINTLKPVVGVAQRYVQQLENYRPHSQPLLNVHQEYIEAWRAHYFAIAAIVDAVEKKDYIQLAKFKNELQEAQQSVAKALEDLARLLHSAGLRSQPVSSQSSSKPALKDPDLSSPEQ